MLVVAGLSLAIAGGAAFAESSDTLDEIIVTATRQAESLKDVPISIAAYTQESLDKQSVQSFADIARMTPGVTFTNRGSGNSHRSDIAIRGITAGPGTATTGLYLDETPIQIRPDCCASSNPYPIVFDLDRVEILRGPQGTLYGAGSEGGTIRFILPEPSLSEQHIYARGGVSFTEHGGSSSEVGAAIGGPIKEDSVGFRLSAFYRKDGGYVDRVDRISQRVITKNADNGDALVVRGALKFEVNDNLAISPSFYFQKERANDTSMYWEAFSNPGQGKFRQATPNIGSYVDQFYLPALKIEWRNDALAFLSNSSYMVRDNTNNFDDTLITMAIFTGNTGVTVPQGLNHIVMPGDVYSGQKVWTQEFRLQNADRDARLNWVAGVFYQDVDQDYHYFVDAHQIDEVLNYGNTGEPVTLADIFGMGLYQGKYILWETESMKNKEIALYANVDFKITDKLKAIAGLRWSHNKFDDIDTMAGPVVSSADGFTVTTSVKDKPVTPKFGLSYAPNANNTLYLTVSKGYRQGFFAPQVATRCQADLDALGVSGAPREIGSDSVWNYEVGSKNRLAGDRVQIDASIFRIDWTDIQSSFSLPCGNTWRGNLGKARSQGFDLSFAARIAGHFTLDLAAGFADAKYTETIRGSGGQVLRADGDRLPVARWNVAASAEYDFIAWGRDGYARLDHKYTSSRPVTDTDPLVPEDPAWSQVDMRIGMKFGSVDLSVFGTNLTEAHPEFNRNRPMSDPPPADLWRGITIRPRTFGATLVYRY
jgi:outer membrane receptor protein involved in Fe transport